jgi:hypothetical protein
MSKIYTRSVFAEFERKMVDCTAFDIEDDPTGGQNCYLVTHTNRTSKISWGQHRFKVRADKDIDDYHCECKEWEHTGSQLNLAKVHIPYANFVVAVLLLAKFICRFVLRALVESIHKDPAKKNTRALYTA